MKQEIRFDMLACGDEFHACGEHQTGSDAAESLAQTLVKKSGSSAYVKADPSSIIRLRTTHRCFVYLPDPSPESVALKNLLRLERTLELAVVYGQEEAVRFAAEIVKDPARTMEWSDSFVRKAADQKVARCALYILEQAQEKGLDPLDTLLDESRKMTVRGARFPHHSTSQPSNAVNEAIVAAWAEVYENLSDRLEKN